ncbi:MAG: hypothetical protein ACI91G_001167 [Gammaproteobacteria bacterium]|jgi:hypothetical protein
MVCDPDHVALFSQFIDRHLVTNGEMIRADPKRGNQHKFTRAMEQIGYNLTAIKSPEPKLSAEFTEFIHQLKCQNQMIYWPRTRSF